jgi:hypothetical protein
LIDPLGLERREGASLEMIGDREAELGVHFPQDYVELRRLTNGIEGFSTRTAHISAAIRSKR